MEQKMQNEGRLPRFSRPLKCILWRDPKRVRDASFFETLQVYEDDSHFRRVLLKCKECAQLYFYELLEYVDYTDGEDPQYRKYIPVMSGKDAVMLSSLPCGDVARCTPAIHSDWPKGQKMPRIFWTGGDAGGLSQSP
jgi:hypothetical protein